MNLLRVAVEDSLDVGIRQVAAITFKNATRKDWDPLGALLLHLLTLLAQRAFSPYLAPCQTAVRHLRTNSMQSLAASRLLSSLLLQQEQEAVRQTPAQNSNIQPEHIVGDIHSEAMQPHDRVHLHIQGSFCISVAISAASAELAVCVDPQRTS